MTSRAESARITIAAPAAVVFDILADPRQHARIDGSGTVRDVVSGPDRLSADARFSMSMKLGAPYRMGNRVVEFEEGRRIAWRHVGLHRWRYELTPLDDGATEVVETWDPDAYPAPLRAALSRVAGPKVRPALPATLERLKAAAEHDAASPTS